MTWHWRISFSLLWLLPVYGAGVKGVVTLANSRDPVVRRHKNYSDVVVWLEPVTPVARRASATGHARHAVMKQLDKHFIPHVLPIAVGTTVDFPNGDPIFHSVFSNYSGQIFDKGLYKPGNSPSEVFKRAGVVRVFCNIHPTMSAVIVVLDTPYFGVTRESGEFEVPDVPPGDYKLHFFHERSTEENLRALVRSVHVNGRPLVLPPVAISETGYIPAPHKDKWGHDYPAVIDDQPAYSVKP